jgi:hypothetical protein
MGDRRLAAAQWPLEIARADLFVCRYQRQQTEADRIREGRQHPGELEGIVLGKRCLDDRGDAEIGIATVGGLGAGRPTTGGFIRHNIRKRRDHGVLRCTSPATRMIMFRSAFIDLDKVAGIHVQVPEL